MAKTTVDYGIDLGTTNSAVAQCTAKGPQIVRVGQLNYIPSAVARSPKSGDIKVGNDAIRADFIPVAKRFKRLMGTEEGIVLADGSKWSPTLLSAEVLKALRSAVKRRNNDDLENVVITVPAMFNQPQCEATNDAAEEAGLRAVALLQEPIAAATAFLSNSPIEGNYLVYDLGGGTFDVSLLRLRDGEMQVLDHGGSNFLGGSDFDRRLVGWVLGQIRDCGASTQSLTSLRGEFELLRSCEEARIALSDQDEATIYLEDFDLPISKLSVSRGILVDLVDDLVTQTIDLTRDRLLSRGFDGSDVKSILLVGGPTQMPYVRERLFHEFGIPLSLDRDPMTVVAEGAALHAGTLLASAPATGISTAEDLSVEFDLHYDPVSSDLETTIAGKVIAPAGFSGEVQVASESGDFETGWMMLTKEAFSCDLILSKDSMSRFTISVRDLKGALMACVPNTIAIRSGIRTAQPIAPYNYGVVKRDGTVGTIVSAGQALPAHGSAPFEVAETLVAGSPEELVIYFVEGNSKQADEAIEVTQIRILGTELSRTLKEGEKVEIKVRIDESRRAKFDVYIPLVDQEWRAEPRRQIDAPDPESLAEALTNTTTALRQIEDHVEPDEQDKLLRAGREIERLENLVDQMEQGSVEDGYQAHKQLADTQAALRPLIDKYEIVALHDQLSARIEFSSSLCDKFSDSMGKAKLADMSKDLDKLMRLKDKRGIEALRERVMDIFWEHYGKTRECAEHQLEWMRDAVPLASDSITYYELVRRAEAALAADDRQAVILYAGKAWDYLPSRERMRNRFADTGIR